MVKTLYDKVEDKKNAVFVIASGDSDFKYPIEDVLKNKVQVEQWSWKSAMAKEHEDNKRYSTIIIWRVLWDLSYAFPSPKNSLMKESRNVYLNTLKH